jgi:hypothetical protein
MRSFYHQSDHLSSVECVECRWNVVDSGIRGGVSEPQIGCRSDYDGGTRRSSAMRFEISVLATRVASESEAWPGAAYSGAPASPVSEFDGKDGQW